MKTELEIDMTFDQILSLVRRLPRQQKIKLTKELEKEAIDTKLTKLLKTFKTEELSSETIDREVENIRQKMFKYSSKI